MARGGPRMGAGRPRKVSEQDAPTKGATKSQAGETLTPLDYLLKVMRDETADPARRDRAAVAAAGYLHPKKSEPTKQDERASAAKKAGSGKFSPSKPPLSVVK